ncbi:MAG: hypothetical protein L0226_03030 [Acidobacteria bacterium]|nr:hypothetical protein [Acidobacteriota bacterium]MCI0664990.1 hypothetical protein [Acidobacteriota bacterium]
MAEKQTECNPFSYLVDSFYASLPEKTADDIGTFKKDVLRGIRDSITTWIDEEIELTDRHLENARRMRERHRQDEAEDTPPSPA